VLFGFGIIGLISLAIWIFALVDAVSVPDNSMYRTGDKLIWVLVILLAYVIGALIYIFVGRPVRDRPGRFGPTY